MSPSRLFRRPCVTALSLFLAVLALVSLAASPAAAQYTWNGGGGDSNWTTGGNWVGGSAPSSGGGFNTLTFTGSTRLSNNTNANPFSALNVTFDSNAGAFTIGGNLQISGGGGYIVNNSANPQTFSGSLKWIYSGFYVNAATADIVLNGVLNSNNSANLLEVKGSQHTVTLGSTGNNFGASGSQSSVSLQIDSGATVKGATIGNNGSSSSFGAYGAIQVAGVMEVTSGGQSTNRTINASGGTLQADTGTLTLTGAVTGGGGLTVAGNGDVYFNGSGNNIGALTVNSGAIVDSTLAGTVYNGNILLNGGRLNIDSSNQIATTANVTVNGGGLLVDGGWSQQITALTLNGTGQSLIWNTLTLSSGATALTMQGGSSLTQITGSSDKVILSGASGGGGVTFDNSVAGSATINLSMDLGGQTRTFNIARGTGAVDMNVQGAISNGGLTKSGSGVLALSGTDTYTGGTTISAGTLQLGNNTPGGSLSLSSAITDNGTLAFNRSNAVRQGTDFIGSTPISGTGGITQIGSGTLYLPAANTYSGPTAINGGVLNVGSLAGVNTASPIGKGSAAGSAADLVINGGTLQYTGAGEQTTNRLFTIGASGATIDASGGTMTLGSGGGAVGFASTAGPPA
jgi:fibronectin-binding autotransporter adhesin